MELNEIKAVMTLAAEHGISINAERDVYKRQVLNAVDNMKLLTE